MAVTGEETLHDHVVPPELLELYEVLEFQKALEAPARRGRSRATSHSRVITRSMWGGRPPRSRTTNITPKGSTGHWEGPHMGGFPHESCATKVRGIQAFHMDSRKWADIAYSTLGCPHGYVFIGRGWGVRTAAQGTDDGNQNSYAHCYLGGQGDPLTVEGKQAMKLAFDLAVQDGGAGPERKCHRDWRSTECPGSELVTFIRGGLVVPGVTPPTPDPNPPGTLPRRWVAMASTPTGKGYWEINADGAVHCYGDAQFFGSASGITRHPIVAFGSLPTNDGYYLFASDGGVFAFGAAQFLGSAALIQLNSPISGAAVTPKGDGYWLLGGDGGVFSYGAASYHGAPTG